MVGQSYTSLKFWVNIYATSSDIALTLKNHGRTIGQKNHQLHAIFYVKKNASISGMIYPRRLGKDTIKKSSSFDYKDEGVARKGWGGSVQEPTILSFLNWGPANY